MKILVPVIAYFPQVSSTYLKYNSEVILRPKLNIPSRLQGEIRDQTAH